MSAVVGSAGIERAVERRVTTGRVDWKGAAFQALLLLALLFCLAALAVLLADVIVRGFDVYTRRGADFLTHGLSRSPLRAGIWQGIKGTLILAVIVTLVAFPLGVATAIYLEEYAPDTRFARIIEVNIRNLAGVPSVVYGLLGLAVFVKLLGDDLTDGGGLTGGRSIISASLTLSVLALPIVIITTSEALRAVPQSLREAGYGIGATRWDVVRTMVLPNAAPGMLTGMVLTISRALGETAPLVLVGGVLGSGFLAEGNLGLYEQMRGGFTALPLVVFGWSRLPQATFRDDLAPAAIMALLAITLLANAVAIVARNRYERRW